MGNVYITYEINLWPFIVVKKFLLGNSLSVAVTLTKFTDPDNYKCSGYGTGFDARGSFLLSDGSGFGKNVIIFGAGMSSLIHIDNRKRYFDSW